MCLKTSTSVPLGLPSGEAEQSATLHGVGHAGLLLQTGRSGQLCILALRADFVYMSIKHRILECSCMGSCRRNIVNWKHSTHFLNNECGSAISRVRPINNSALLILVRCRQS